VELIGRRSRGKGKRKSMAYYRAETAQPLGLRISPAMACGSCADKGKEVVVVRLPDTNFADRVEVTNMATGEAASVNLSISGEVTIAATLNQRLQILTKTPQGGIRDKQIVMVPGVKDGKLIEMDEGARRPFYEPKLAPAR